MLNGQKEDKMQIKERGQGEMAGWRDPDEQRSGLDITKHEDSLISRWSSKMQLPNMFRMEIILRWEGLDMSGHRWQLFMR